MRKIFLLATVFSLAFSCMAGAFEAIHIDDGTPKAKIAIVLDAPTSYTDNEKVLEMVPAKAKEMLKNKHVDIVDFDQSTAAIRTYREDHRECFP